MPLITTNAVIIRTIDYKDSSKILTLFSEKYGRMSCIAHGAKRLSSITNASYQIGNLVRVSIYKKQDIQTMGTISQIDIINQYMKVKMDFKRLGLMQYIIEFVYRNTEDGATNPELHDLLLKGLENLNSEIPIENWKSIWDYHALTVIGFEPVIWNCVSCGKEINSGIWVAEEGGLSCGCRFSKGITLREEDILSLRRTAISFPSQETFPITMNVVESLNRMINSHAFGPFHSLSFFI